MEVNIRVAALVASVAILLTACGNDSVDPAGPPASPKPIADYPEPDDCGDWRKLTPAEQAHWAGSLYYGLWWEERDDTMTRQGQVDFVDELTARCDRSSPSDQMVPKMHEILRGT